MKISELLSKEEFKNILSLCNFSSIYIDTIYCKHIYDLYTMFTSQTYNSQFIFIQNTSYKLMLANLCNAIDKYCSFVQEYTIPVLYDSKEFLDLFEWFFNDKLINYVGNFCFICEQLRINKLYILNFLIYITKLKLSPKKWRK